MASERGEVPDTGFGRAVRRIGAQLRKTLLKLRLGQRWEQTESGLRRRVYPDYDTYIAHQKTKFDAARGKFVRRHDQRFYDALTERLTALATELKGRSVLCIAARQGTEVRAFIDRGAFAIGIDLNPGRANRYVVTGDFHALQYADGSVQVAYTNSLDHAYELDRVLAEIHRVLVADGLLIAELNGGDDEPSAAGFYESSSWSSIDDMTRRIEAHGFRLEQRSRFEVPWRGEQLVLRRTVTRPAA
ncbi:MAG TPA: methyltransferase domain-containing protein [Longimicrobiales bacterium]